MKNIIIKFSEKYYNLLMYVAFCLLFFYVFNCTLRHVLYPNQILLFLNFVISAILVLIANFKYISVKNIKIRKHFLIMLVIISFLVIFRNADIINGHYGLPFYTVFAIFLSFVLSFSDKWYKIAINVIIFFVLEHVIATFICYLFPSFYYNCIMPLFPEYKTELLYQFNHNQIAGITQHYSTNALYLTVGLMIIPFNTKRNKKDNKYFYYAKIFFVFLIIIALLLTGKRTQVLFSTTIYLIIYIINNRSNLIKGFKSLLKYLIIFSTIILILSIFIPTITNSFKRIANSITNTNAFDTRKPLYALAINKFEEKPIFGWGWGNYKYVYNNEVEMKERNFMNAHCIYLQLLMETGIIGFTIIVGFMLYLIKINIKLILKKVNFKNKNILYMTFSYQLYFLFEGIFGNSLYDIPVFVPYSVVISLLIIFNSKNNKLFFKQG